MEKIHPRLTVALNNYYIRITTAEILLFINKLLTPNVKHLLRYTENLMEGTLGCRIIC